MQSKTSRLVLTAGLVLTTGLLAGLSPSIARQGDAAHRTKMSALESRPFPVDALGSLDGWIAGDPISSEHMTSGNVVAFAFIDVGNPASMTVLNTLTRLARTEGEKGLTVFAVHQEAQWDGLVRLFEQNRVRVPVAKDVGGKFVEAMGADGTPDLYLVDRAGQLRYADIETRALEMAISRLMRETAEQAVTNASVELRTREASMASEPARPAAAPPSERKQVSPEQYRAAAWPAHNTGTLHGRNVQGQTLPVAMGSETWLTPKQDLTGKVVVLDFWATWCGPCINVMPALDAMQKQHPQKLAILGVAGQGEDLGKVQSFLKTKSHSYGQLFDQQQRVYKSLEIRAIPHVVVLSTDGVVRWQGNPGSPAFRQAVEQVLRVDPGL